MSNKTQLQTNNSALEALITRVATAKDTVASLPEANDTTDATAVASDILSGKTAYVSGQKITGTIAFAPAQTITPSITSQIAISSGYYASGNITVAGDSNLVSENIKKGTSIFGVSGNYEGSGGSGEADYSIEDNLVTGQVTTYTNNRVSQIIPYLFCSNKSLTAVEFNACKQIGSSAFYYCYTLSSISFPAVEGIGSYAFYNCTQLTSISFPKCSYIGASAFNLGYKITNISLPMCSIIGTLTFGRCSALTSLYCPELCIIGSEAFYLCSALSNIDLPKCTEIRSSAFYGCYKLASISCPKTRELEAQAFRYCSKLTSITLPRCSYIDYSVFQACTSLSQLTLNAPCIAKLNNINAFSGTLLSTTGSIYVPALFLNSYKSATNWATYASRIFPIEGSPDNIVLISFTIESVTCYAETGMVWQDWLDSDYNIVYCEAYNNKIYHEGGGGYSLCKGVGGEVQVTDTIIDGATYTYEPPFVPW